MTKKKYIIKNKFLFFGLMVAFCVIVIFILYSLENHFNKFNPETDVCTQFHIGNCIKQLNNPNKCHDLYWDNPLNFSEYCTDWRPKNKCELDIDAEGCICDEYISCEKIYLEEYPNRTFCLIQTEEGKEPMLYENWEKHSWSNDCIKSHLPNECELKNPNWVWDYKLTVKVPINCDLNKNPKCNATFRFP